MACVEGVCLVGFDFLCVLFLGGRGLGLEVWRFGVWGLKYVVSSLGGGKGGVSR